MCEGIWGVASRGRVSSGGRWGELPRNTLTWALGVEQWTRVVQVSGVCTVMGALLVFSSTDSASVAEELKEKKYSLYSLRCDLTARNDTFFVTLYCLKLNTGVYVKAILQKHFPQSGCVWFLFSCDWVYSFN